MKLLILAFAFLFVFNVLNAQTDSLSHYSLTQLDSLCKTKKKPQEQLPYALALLQKGEKELDTQDTAYAKLLFYAGNNYLNLRDRSNATNYLEKAIAIWQEKMPVHTEHANCLHSLGMVYYYQGKNQEAENYWLEALDIQRKTSGEEHPDFGSILNSLGVLYKKKGNYAQAENCYLQVLNIRKKSLGEEHLDYAGSLSNLGSLYWSIGNYTMSESYYLQALNIRKKISGEEHQDYAANLNNLGILYKDMGDYIKAEPYYMEALALKKKIFGEENLECASMYNNIGLFYIETGNYVQAEIYYIQALKIKKKELGEQHVSYAVSINNLAELYRKTGAYAKAESYHIQAMNIRKKTLGEMHIDYAGSLNNLGALFQNMGNYAQAESYYLQALDIKKNVLGEEHINYASSLNSLGAVYWESGNYEKAESYYTQAINIYKKVLGEAHPSYAASIGNLGVLYQKRGDYAKAEAYWLQALDIEKKVFGEEHPSYALMLLSLGFLYNDKGDSDKAINYQLQSLNIYKKAFGESHPDYVLNLESLGSLYMKKGNYEEADRYYTNSFNFKKQNLSANFSWLSEKGKAAYWQKEKGFYEVLNNYTAQSAAAFPQAVALAYNGNLIAKGLLLESAKEREDAVMQSKDSIILQIYQELKDKKKLINHLVSSGTGKKAIIDRYEAEADSLDKILVGRLGDYGISKRKFQITWKDVQNALTDNEIAIEFARYYNKQDSQYYYMALMVKKGYEMPKLVKLGSEKNISAIPAGKGFADLYKLIWEPMDSLLQDVKTVYYSPDGVLNNIAFAALCSKGTEKVVNTKEIKRGSVGKTGGVEMENCTYLSERYTLHQVSITRYLAEGLKTSKTDNSMLVFGGVNYDEIPSTGDTIAEAQIIDFEDYALAENISRSSNNQSRMEYLPGTQTELQNVQKILHKKQWKIRAFSDKNASENTLKTEIQKESPSVLHIATHGFAFPDIIEKKNDIKTYRDADNPMARCGLLLAGANHSWTGNAKTVLSQTGEDGILTALEVSNLPLKNTKLVVLSACETGLGKIQGTEGVFGLKRGFKLALVEQIIVSLWSVPDKETMELMDIFYNDLAKTHNAVISFEKAQKEMRKKYATRPDLWAGFVLVR